MNDYMKEVCKIGQGADCCRYLGAGTTGLECLKVNLVFKAAVDKSWATTDHVAQGDNCEGQENLSEAKIQDIK